MKILLTKLLRPMHWHGHDTHQLSCSTRTGQLETKLKTFHAQTTVTDDAGNVPRADSSHRRSWNVSRADDSHRRRRKRSTRRRQPQTRLKRSTRRRQSQTTAETFHAQTAATDEAETFHAQTAVTDDAQNVPQRCRRFTALRRRPFKQQQQSINLKVHSADT